MSNKSLRVLVVEDQAIAAKAATMLLTALGAEVELAKSGEEALEMVKEDRYHVIFMDIGLPGIDGLETARQISYSYSVPIYALTGHAGLSDEDKEYSSITRVYSKPLSREMAEDALFYATRELPDNKLKTSLATIDIELGTHLMGKSKSRAIDMFTLLYEELPNEKHRMVEAFTKKDFEALYEIVEVIRDTVSNAGVPCLQRAANRAYSAMSHHKELHPCRELIWQMIGEMDMFVREYPRFFGK